jgi:hypothetical protein
MDSIKLAEVLVRMARSICAEQKLIFILNKKGWVLGKDGKFYTQTAFSHCNTCMREYKSLSQAKKFAKEKGYDVVAIVGDEYHLDLGTVIEKVTTGDKTKEVKHPLKDFIVFRG